MSEPARVFQMPRRHPEPLLTLAQLVERYQFSERYWRYRLKEGMPAHKWGGQWRFRASEVESWMEDRDAA